MDTDAPEGGQPEDLVEDPLAPPVNVFDEMTPEQLAEAAAEAQERSRRQWATEDSGRRTVAETAGETVADLQARIAAAHERDREQAEREAALAEERARWEAERLEAQRVARIESWDLRMRELYPRFEAARIVGLDPPVAADVRSWLERDKPGALILLGKTGTGKTFAAFAAAREVFCEGGRTRFWPVPNLLDALRPGRDGDRVFLDAREVDLLVLDDIGVEKKSDWTAERLYIVVNDRWLQQKRMIVTCNLSMKDMKDAIGDRMYSRLRDDATIIQIKDDKDRRISA